MGLEVYVWGYFFASVCTVVRRSPSNFVPHPPHTCTLLRIQNSDTITPLDLQPNHHLAQQPQAAVIVTMLTITQHLLQTRQRQLRSVTIRCHLSGTQYQTATSRRRRTYTIRVLLMVPIYAIEALMGLVMREWSEIFEVWRYAIGC